VTNVAKEGFEDHGIWVINWPAHSPDMNPIEHFWRALKSIILRRHPNIHLLGNKAVEGGGFKEMGSRGVGGDTSGFNRQAGPICL
jgi:hypothetical protein